MNYYTALNKQEIRVGDYKIIPIRGEDKFLIMKWRNDQMFHLRQKEILTRTNQEKYFNNVVSQLFTEKKPSQLLFSYLKNEKCIGYGGLVHINWEDMTSEISFLMDTQLEKKYFVFHWKIYLSLIQEIAFKELKFNKIYTYAYDKRPLLYDALEDMGFTMESKLKEYNNEDENYINVIIHSKHNPYK